MSTQEDKTKHTPLPWKLGALPPPEWRYIIDPEGDVITTVAEWDDAGELQEDFQDERAQANAELIVRAVNSYSQLVEALSAIVDSASDGRPVPEWLEERLVDARAALKAAEVER